MSQLLTGAIYIPMKLSHCSLESGKVRPEQMASHRKRWVEGCMKGTDGDDEEFSGCGVEGMGTGGHFRNCVSEHGTLLAVCRSNDGEQTTHRSCSCTQFTEFSSRSHRWAMDLTWRSSRLLPPCLWIPATNFSWTLSSFPRSLWLGSLLVHLSSTVSSPVSDSIISPTHGLSTKIINCGKGGRMTIIADNGCVV